MGNSGNTGEPHLHVHAQRPGPVGAPLGGDPLPLLFGGRFPVRGDRSAAGLALTALLEGREGMTRLGAHAVRWRAGPRWYGVALMTMPLLLLAVLWPMSVLFDPTFAPRFQWPLFAIGLVAGSFEEIGWTGFATPRLLARHRLFFAGLPLGLLWALWHVLVDFRQNYNSLGTAWLLQFAVFYLAALTAYRVLMTWVYANTQSLLLAVLMRARLHRVAFRAVPRHFVGARARLANRRCCFAVRRGCHGGHADAGFARRDSRPTM